ncbi:hypothetical protein LJK87_10085 [Paenibacillus sp. P25]|nr:hypothetical protein LJK87_10085 [Paenibacillus sp. P25]
MNLSEQFGNIDIYLFDQLLKGRIAPGMKPLDAGLRRREKPGLFSPERL